MGSESADMAAFVGRHPIFNREQQVVAYELLFRSGETNKNLAGQGDEVSFAVLHNSLSVFGLDALTSGKMAYVNFTRQLLLNADYTVLPKENTVIELLENIKPDAEVIDACKQLKKYGYRLAIDDVVSVEHVEPFLGLVDIVKVDFMGTTTADREALRERLDGYKLDMLAEKVETRAQYKEALAQGYAMLQGYFFCQPEIIEGQDIPGVKQNYLRLLAEVNQPDIDFDKFEQIIKSDVSLTSKLLKYLNSASFGVRHKISSIKQAMVLLGAKPLQKWVSLVTMSQLGIDQPDELMITSLTRAKFCESVAGNIDMESRQFDLFMTGLMSMLDVMLGRPISELLDGMSLSNDVKETLMGRPTLLSNIYELAVSLERQDHAKIESLVKRIEIDLRLVNEAYRQSIFWADQASKAA